MPNYNLSCSAGHEQIDVLLKVGERPPCPECGAATETLWRGSAPLVVSDEIDIWVRHGIMNPDGSPKRYTSKAEMARAAKEKGLVNVVRHVGSEGSDKARWTTRWF